MAVFGKTGTGKSTLLRSVFIDFVTSGHGVTVIDPHGTLVSQLVEDIPAHRLSDVVYLDLADPDYAFGINLFSATGYMTPAEKTQKVNQVKSLFRKVGGDVSAPLIETWLPVLAHTFLDAGEGTFVDIPRVLSDKPYRDRLMTRLENNFSRYYWQSHIDKNGILSQSEVDSTVRRFGKFLTNPLLEQIVGQEKTTIPFQQIMDENMILLVSLPNDDQDTTALLGTLIFQELFNATVKRSSQRPYAIIADECQLVVTPDLSRFIDEARKRNVGMVLATQRPGKMGDASIEEALMNVGTLITLTVDYDDAAKLGKRFPRMAEPFQTYIDMSPYPTVSIRRYGHPNPRAVQIVNEINTRISEDPTMNGCDSLVRDRGNFSVAARNGILSLTRDRFGIKENLPDLFFELHAIVAMQPQLEPAGMHKPEPADKQLQLLSARHGDGAAMVNIRGNESLIRVSQKPQPSYRGNLFTIRAASRRRYYRRRFEVAEDIRNRLLKREEAAAPSFAVPDEKQPPKKPYDLPVTRRARKA